MMRVITYQCHSKHEDMWRIYYFVILCLVASKMLSCTYETVNHFISSCKAEVSTSILTRYVKPASGQNKNLETSTPIICPFAE